MKPMSADKYPRVKVGQNVRLKVPDVDSATEIQNIQIGDGNIPHRTEIPIYMIFPRLFTCPTLIKVNFKIEFELNIVIIFEDDHLVSENFAIILTRE